jgi:hypothetical protein
MESDIMTSLLARGIYYVEVVHYPSKIVAKLRDLDMTLSEALERAFEGTQNVDGSWVEDKGQLGVTVEPQDMVVQDGGCRSTSVGDYMRVVDDDGHMSLWKVAPVGWERC